jgi:hypothetical protein
MIAALLFVGQCLADFDVQSKNTYEDGQKIDEWMEPLIGKYSLNGSQGCEDFQIKRNSSLFGLNTFYYLDFGNLRFPEEEYLIGNGDGVTLEGLSDDNLKFTVNSTTLYETDVSSSSVQIKIDIQLFSKGSLKSISVINRHLDSYTEIYCYEKTI